MNAAAWRQFRLILQLDLRLLWRGWLGKFGDTVVNIGVWITIFVLMHAVFAALVFLFPQPPLAVEAGIWVFAALFIIAGSMTNMQLARPDGTLLFSSPVSPQAVLAARLASQTFAGLGPATFFLLPLVNLMAVRHGPGYLAGYVVLLALGLIGATFATALSLALIRLLGAKRAVNAVRIGGFVLVAVAIVTPRLFDARNVPGAGAVRELLASGLASAPLRGLAAAGRGDPLALLIVVVLAGGAALLCARLLQRAFVSGAIDEVGARRAGSRPAAHRWSGTVGRAIYVKELRLLAREPMLFAQLLPTFANMLPLFFVFRGLGWLMLAPLACLLSHLLTLGFGPMVVAGDEAWDVARSSPLAEPTYRRYKLLAALTVPLGVGALLCTVLALVGHGLWALVAFIVLVPGNAAVGWFLAANITPVVRRGVIKHKRAEGFASAMLGLAIGGLASGALAALVSGRALLGWSLVGGYLLFCVLVFFAAKLSETPDWKFEEMRRAAESK